MSSSFLRLRARASRVLAAVAVVLAILPSGASRADDTPQTLPFSQDWSNIGLITSDDDWSAVPGVIGYRGDGLASGTGVNPQTVVAASTVIDVNANQTNPNTFTSGGVTEFHIANPVVALQGSVTARAPYIQIHINTTGLTGIHVSYNVRDVDGSGDNAVQPVALQFRVGSSGNFTNVPAGFVADATTGGAATAVTPVSVTLPATADNQPLVQVRMITTDAVGSDEWVGIDDISITGSAVPTPTPPTGTGSANPSTLFAGGSADLTVQVTPGTNPTSTGLTVRANLSSIGGSSTQEFVEGPTNTFTFTAMVAPGTAIGPKSLPVTITDGQGRSGGASIGLTVDQPPPPIDHVVISQVYGGGGNTGATYQHDFVELYNPGTIAFDLTGWSLQYASSMGSGWGGSTQPIGGVIAPGEYYLVSLATNGAVGAELPPANISGEINMSGTSGKIALVSNGEPLSGNCPLGDPDLVDFVGYGAAADCHEGAANTPNLSSTLAAIRKNDGNRDTNSNGSDFETGEPNPRRTAPIVEIGPAVLNTDPFINASSAPRDATITVNFTEPVDVTGAWFHVTCATTGVHDDATVARTGLRSFAITPNVNFLPGESCSVTIFKDAVHDQDLDDAAPDTDTLRADFVWTFTVATGTAPPYPPDVHLTMGNPSGATADLNVPNNYLMQKPEFALSYNRQRGGPNWVSWHLDDSWVGTLDRVDTFRADPAVPPDWYRVQATDFVGTGFDRGHMTPNADRDKETSIPINQATFLMSNMVPQAPDNNQGPWANFEGYLRSLLGTTNEIYIVSGPAGTGGTGSNGGVTSTIANDHITVPAATWKVALVLTRGDDDVARVSATTRTIAVIMPNVQGIRNVDWHTYLTTVDAVEELTGYDLFSNVEDAVEHSIEAGKDGVNPPGTADQLVALEEDSSKSFTLNAVGMNPSTLTYTVLSGPFHGAVTGSDGGRTYVPAHDFVGDDTFTYQVSDGIGTSNTATVTLNVLEVNDDPTAVNDTKTADEDGPLTFEAADLTANDTAGPANESGQTLTVTSVTATGDTHGAVSLAGGKITYVPETNFNGSASFTYQVCDNGISAGVSDPKCASATVLVAVAPVNDAPTAANDTKTTDEDSPLAFAAADLTVNDTAGPASESGQILTVTSVAATGDTHGTVSLAGGQVTYVPAPNFNGPASFTYQVCDDGISAGVADPKCAVATVAVTVASRNDDPVAAADTTTTDEDTPVVIDVLANDTDPDGDGLLVGGLSGAAKGSVSVIASGPDAGKVRYTPNANANGADTFTYTVSDGHGGSATAGVSVWINSQNDPPVFTFVPSAATTPELTPYTFAAQASDVDSANLTFSLVGAPDGATIDASTGQFSWTPSEAQGGTGTPYAFKVRVTDGTSNVDADIAITVTEVNQSPALIVGTSHTVSLGDTLTFTAGGSDADIPVQALSFGLSGAVPAGATIDAATGVFTWTPTAAQSGATYAFNVTITDGVTSTAVAVAVSVIGPLGIERDVLDRVTLLRKTVQDPGDAESLDKVIAALTDAVQSQFWIDASHLDPRKGDKVFDEDAQAVRELVRLKREGHSAIPDSLLQGFIDSLVKATRLLAETTIGEAVTAGGDSGDIAKANADLAEGNQDAALGRPEKAIEDYGAAWRRALGAVK
jgi:DNA/RNA endonuclease G (NUC1)